MTTRWTLLLATVVLTPGCAVCSSFCNAFRATGENFSMCCRDSGGTGTARVSGRDYALEIVPKRTEWHIITRPGHPPESTQAATLLTLVFTSAAAEEVIVQIVLENYAFADSEPPAAYPIPRGGVHDGGKIMRAEIVEPKGAAAIHGGTLRVIRWIDMKFEGELNLELTDGGFVKTAFLAERNNRLSDPKFRGGGGLGD